MAKNIGFYQNFNLTLDRLSSALRCVQTNPQVSHIELAECMSVNNPVAEGFSAWLTHTGLAIRVGTGYELTPFGRLASQHDPFLADIATQWTLHYYLATEHTERSEAWYVFINEFLSLGQSFSSDQFQAYFASVTGLNVKNRSAIKKDPNSVLYTYVQSKSLGKLNLLRKQKRDYAADYPNTPHILVIGYTLFDWWQRRYDQTNTLHFSQLCEEAGSLGRLYLADSQQVRRFVADLTGLGYLSFSETQHQPVNRLHNKPPHLLLERYYKER